MDATTPVILIKSSIIALFVAREIMRSKLNKESMKLSIVNNEKKNENMVKIVILGCGCSGATPLLSCILGLFPNKPLNGKRKLLA
jgi:hypothetical protein